MTYSTAQLAAMDAEAISRCSPKHMQSVIAELIASARAFADDARRYEYLLTCDYIAAKQYLPGLDEAGHKAKLRAKHDAAMLAAAPAPSVMDGSDQDQSMSNDCKFCEGQGEVQGQGSYADFEPPIKKCSECSGTGKRN